MLLPCIAPPHLRDRVVTWRQKVVGQSSESPLRTSHVSHRTNLRSSTSRNITNTSHPHHDQHPPLTELSNSQCPTKRKAIQQAAKSAKRQKTVPKLAPHERMSQTSPKKGKGKVADQGDQLPKPRGRPPGSKNKSHLALQDQMTTVQLNTSRCLDIDSKLLACPWKSCLLFDGLSP